MHAGPPRRVAVQGLNNLILDAGGVVGGRCLLLPLLRSCVERKGEIKLMRRLSLGGVARRCPGSSFCG